MLHTAIIGGATLSGKREKFVELAEARVSRTMKDIRLIGNLSNRAAYNYLPKSVAYLPSPNVLIEQLRVAGFADATHQQLSGGLTQLMLATKS
jgi:ubiquinone/menaquinone biosynthesis C-methylase UbiE